MGTNDLTLINDRWSSVDLDRRYFPSRNRPKLLASVAIDGVEDTREDHPLDRLWSLVTMHNERWSNWLDALEIRHETKHFLVELYRWLPVVSVVFVSRSRTYFRPLSITMAIAFLHHFHYERLHHHPLFDFLICKERNANEARFRLTYVKVLRRSRSSVYFSIEWPRERLKAEEREKRFVMHSEWTRYSTF